MQHHEENPAPAACSALQQSADSQKAREKGHPQLNFHKLCSHLVSISVKHFTVGGL